VEVTTAVVNYNDACSYTLYLIDSFRCSACAHDRCTSSLCIGRDGRQESHVALHAVVPTLQTVCKP
jgi:hypothetical protein